MFSERMLTVRRRGSTALVVAALFIAAAPVLARADDRQRVTLLEENDSLYFNSDKHYTQGLRLSYLGPDVAADSFWARPFDFLDSFLPIFPGDAQQRSRRYALSLGQSIFTPADTDLFPPPADDRPYAGWLYAGVSLLQDSDRRTLDHLELQLGVIGPAALGRQVQNDWHQFIDISEAEGWSEQLKNEPGIVLSYERKWRVPLVGDGTAGIDVIPELGGSLGNIFTYGEAGALLRFGKNLQADYGPVRIRPALSGTDYFNADYLDGDFGIYGFVGVQGRAVGRNVFLDGNTFEDSRSVDKNIFVGDVQAGVSMFWSSAVRLDFSVVGRSKEFEGQDTPDVIGTAQASFGW
jgi:hypothetical protein